MLGWILFAAGCSGPSPETRIEELRVVAMVADPPEIGPLDETRVDVYVADPEEEGVEVLVWACTNLGEGCLEEQGGAIGIATGTPQDGLLTVDLSPSPILDGLTTGGLSLEATALWALACRPGQCPLIEEASGAEDYHPWSNRLGADLSDPLGWMADLPRKGVSLAFRLLTVSDLPEDERHDNPTIVALFEELPTLRRGKKFNLDFRLDGVLGEEARVFNYITGGGFKMTETYVGGTGDVRLEGFAPKKAGPVDMWVVFNDGLGGVAVWTASTTVQ